MRYEDALKLAEAAAGLGRAEDFALQIMSADAAYNYKVTAARLVLEFVPDDEVPDRGSSGLCPVCSGCGDPECCTHGPECFDPNEIRDKIAHEAAGPRPPRPERPLMRVVYCPPVKKGEN